MDADRMPGDAEAAGAIAGMSDTYGHLCPTVGDRISWRMEEGEFDTGRVERIVPGPYPRLIVRSEFTGEVLTIDPQMWPAGNRLDF